MSLSSALNSVQSTFNNTARQSSVVSTNIANANNSDYVRREASISTSLAGAQVVSISRAQEDALLKQYLQSDSKDSAQQTLVSGLEELKSALGGNDYETSPSTNLTAFRDALQTFRTSPNSTIAAQSAVTAAQDLAISLNNASDAVQSLRASADADIATQVDTLNNLLSQFESANNAVKSATATGADTSSALDEREKLLKQISSLVGISAVVRENSDMALYTSEGAVLFETVPRSVTSEPTATYVAGTDGNAIYIDGVALSAGEGATSDASGSLQALLQLRDEIAPTFQSQLDEIAKSLVQIFSETDGSTSAPGLFVWTESSGAAGDTPTSSNAIDGIAATISVNTAVVTSAGGDPMALRDGSISGITDLNSANNSGFSDNLDSLYLALDAKRQFSAEAGISTDLSLTDYASESIGWLEQYRSDATTAAENTTAALSRSSEAYSNETGVNLDEELTLLLDIEQSYKAATKMLNAIDEMLQSLLDIAS
ncbi:flagellar hook-associated protein 1 FlgK [Rhizobium mongolense subsp. loessense]|uniref:Flagellar hook-associated protein 1 n=1 Tax=Rhizobium mongolense subsp. loessense TaxID=158890 RepID=A0A1G4U5Y0_9HYPH|nr:flagellar hook-associated protein FlgK [Rhizobium mongolense]SCW89048.1 flagellar hook-associated protein 1 FlgK [Rhizobium mongolense subsp. loessense]